MGQKMTTGLLLFIVVVGGIWFFAEKAPILGVLLLVLGIVSVLTWLPGGGKR